MAIFSLLCLTLRENCVTWYYLEDSHFDDWFGDLGPWVVLRGNTRDVGLESEFQTCRAWSTCHFSTMVAPIRGLPRTHSWFRVRSRTKATGQPATTRCPTSGCPPERSTSDGHFWRCEGKC